MKQILFLIVLVLVGYFVLWGGTTRVLYKADISPKTLISNIASGVDESFLPQVDPARHGFKYTNSKSFNTIKNNVFLTYDPEICFAFVDLVYSSGSSYSESVMKEYFKIFVLPEDYMRILNLLKSYKDKQSMNILLTIYNSENNDEIKPAVLTLLAEYHLPEVARLIKGATFSEDEAISKTAQGLSESLAEERWFQEGLKNNTASGNGVNLDLDLSYNKNHLGQQYHKGSDFENKMKSY